MSTPQNHPAPIDYIAETRQAAETIRETAVAAREIALAHCLVKKRPIVLAQSDEVSQQALALASLVEQLGRSAAVDTDTASLRAMTIVTDCSRRVLLACGSDNPHQEIARILERYRPLPEESPAHWLQRVSRAVVDNPAAPTPTPRLGMH